MALVSVNIPTFNSAKTLRESLESIKAQTFKDVEIIVIDSYSKDNTIKIATEFNAKIFFADSLAIARQIGVEHSEGKYIFLLDSDQILAPDTIRECVRVCEQDSFDGVTLIEESLLDGNTFVEKLIAYDKWLFHSLHDDHPVYGSAIPRFFKTEYIKKIDFLNNPPITFEHSIIHKQIVNMGARIKFIDSYIYHYETPTFKDVFKKFKRYGYYYIPALKKDANLVFHHSLPRRAYFTRKAFKKPVLLISLFYLYFIKAIASATGVLVYTKDTIFRKKI